MNVRLYVWQRLTAAIMAPLVLAHIVVIFYATRKGLSAADILARTRGSFAWASFYGAFVVAVAIHAAIGIRNVLTEWSPLEDRGDVTPYTDVRSSDPQAAPRTLVAGTTSCTGANWEAAKAAYAEGVDLYGRYLGTDTAPHTRAAKECDCGAAGLLRPISAAFRHSGRARGRVGRHEPAGALCVPGALHVRVQPA